MDELDLAILDELTSDRAILFAGLNPRLSPETMSRRLSLDPSTIRARIRAWEDHGFLRGFEVLPNPTILGRQHWVGYAMVPEPEARPGFVADLELMDGVVCTLEHVHGLVGIALYVAHAEEARRRMDLIGKLACVKETFPPFHPFAQAAAGSLTALEWRILMALRAQPKARLQDIAAHVGISVNTMGTRYARLVEQGAFWCVASLDFTRFIGGVFVRGFVELDGRTTLAAMADAATLAVRPRVFVRRAGAGAGGVTTAHVMAVLDSVAQVEDFQRALKAVDGVQGVRLMFPRSYHVHSRWVEEQIHSAAAQVGVPARPERS